MRPHPLPSPPRPLATTLWLSSGAPYGAMPRRPRPAVARPYARPHTSRTLQPVPHPANNRLRVAPQPPPLPFRPACTTVPRCAARCTAGVPHLRLELVEVDIPPLPYARHQQGHQLCHRAHARLIRAQPCRHHRVPMPAGSTYAGRGAGCGVGMHGMDGPKNYGCEVHMRPARCMHVASMHHHIAWRAWMGAGIHAGYARERRGVCSTRPAVSRVCKRGDFGCPSLHACAFRSSHGRMHTQQPMYGLGPAWEAPGGAKGAAAGTGLLPRTRAHVLPARPTCW